jgi:small subunit ribosomal protein S1
VEIEEGIEGLVHVSEMDWTNKNVNPNKVIHLGQEVEVMVLDVDADRRRISLGVKQCTPNPWAAFAEKHEKGERVKGKIKSITDFGIFLELEGGIDGLIYLSDIAWSETDAQETLRKYQKSDELEAVILAIDVERERIALGLKQLAEDPLANFLTENEKGTLVTGKVVEVDQKQATVELSNGVRGVLRASEICAEKVDDARTKLQIGDSVEARIMGTDRKTHAITLSMKAKDAKAPAAKKASSKTGKAASGTAATTGKKKKSAADSLKTTLGDLFNIGASDDKEEGAK